ncbi:hypothetical protein [Candidimonas nitroreducens]|uniref:Uncharacterized protein n=1 Tax=Candidimonas nitroreducens TaxID=683354 RepID=A0A225MC60_9BURK|nr:hypothetical protein [Candidimonas nitroreducens]OWT58302.1 hypothetical protein CEY11_15030 [Candidimonas nitroreducens]
MSRIAAAAGRPRALIGRASGWHYTAQQAAAGAAHNAVGNAANGSAANAAAHGTAISNPNGGW